MKTYNFFHASDFLIMDALSKKPMSTRELSHLLQMSDRAVVKRLKRFEESEPPMVVKRSGDRRWVPTVVMRVETPKETVEAVTRGVVIPPENLEETVRQKPESVLPPPAPKKYVPPAPQEKVSETALKLSKQMNIPASMVEYGEVSIGKVSTCVKCEKTTPFRYGGTSVCPKCSRGGR